MMEMFPTLQKIDAQNFVALANGDLEKAVQMVLVQLETGEIKSPIQLTNRHRLNVSVRLKYIFFCIKI